MEVIKRLMVDLMVEEMVVGMDTVVVVLSLKEGVKEL